MPYFYLSKTTKYCQANTTSSQKWGKFDAKAIAKVENALNINKKGQIILLPYILTILVICKLSKL